MEDKKNKGQFYTVNSSYILQGLVIPKQIQKIIEPFAGKGDLLDWIKQNYPERKFVIESYDLDPKRQDIKVRDTLLDPPNYKNSFVITNPPYLARNKSKDKTVFDKYKTNDLYKSFLHTLQDCEGGILIIPAGFFLSPRDIDYQCRNNFLTKYKITRVNYFEEQVFPDTTTTVVCFLFEKTKELKTQSIPWNIFPKNEEKVFVLNQENNWIIGGDIYQMDIPKNIKIRRYVNNMVLEKNEQLTNLTLCALDSGKEKKICLEYKANYVYEGKETSRTFATLCIRGRTLSENEQKQLSQQFNNFIKEKRKETWSLFLPQYRESKEYARKRIPFDLAYRIISNLINSL